jgi:hypothetical protein
MTSGDIANFAEAPTSHPNTASKGFALVRATHATPTGREALVYNLTVEGEHEFVANGIVTKNSDATLYGWRAATAFAQKPEELVIRPPGSAARFIAQEEEMLARAADDAKNGKTRPFWLKGRSGQRTQQTARARAMGWRVLG